MAYRMLNNLNILNENMRCRAPTNSPVPVTSRLVRIAFTAQKPPRPRAADPRRRQKPEMGLSEGLRTVRPKTAHPKKRRSLVNGSPINPSPKWKGGRPKAAHHMNHPMFIPGREESSDEEKFSEVPFEELTKNQERGSFVPESPFSDEGEAIKELEMVMRLSPGSGMSESTTSKRPLNRLRQFQLPGAVFDTDSEEEIVEQKKAQILNTESFSNTRKGNRCCRIRRRGRAIISSLRRTLLSVTQKVLCLN
ncbi:uncharacterized protein LOC134821174 [Bolinopsis microptera]|uniref:uncharacterized protein LOC134821174 n=1 Tax=Bolinopsis microptera TaxID=2820187 RepID=UPI00307AD097